MLTRLRDAYRRWRRRRLFKRMGKSALMASRAFEEVAAAMNLFVKAHDEMWERLDDSDGSMRRRARSGLG